MPKVMVVDDEPDIIESVKTILEAEGYDVTCANGGEECLKKLEKEKVDLVLMDFFMPGMDGRMVIEKIREKPGSGDVKVAFLTAVTFRKRGMEIIEELNISDYIIKPIEMNDFTSRIKKITER